jgi:hypothetical protein
MSLLFVKIGVLLNVAVTAVPLRRPVAVVPDADVHAAKDVIGPAEATPAQATTTARETAPSERRTAKAERWRTLSVIGFTGFVEWIEGPFDEKTSGRSPAPLLAETPITSPRT